MIESPLSSAQPRALALSIAVHLGGLLLLAMTVNPVRVSSDREAVPVDFRIEHLGFRIEHREPVKPPAAAPAARPLTVVRPPVLKDVQQIRVPIRVARNDGTPNAPRDYPAAASVQKPDSAHRAGTPAGAQTATAAPDVAAAAPDVATTTPAPTPTAAAEETRASFGPSGYGTQYEPVLRDRSLRADVLAALGPKGTVTITVGDDGRATDVRFNAPSADPAVLEELRRRLLAARYLPGERDGIANEATLALSNR